MSGSSKILAMAGFGLLGLLPGAAGTFLWTRHQSQASAREEQEKSQAGANLSRLSAGDLRSTLLYQNSVRAAEVKTASAFLQQMQVDANGLSTRASVLLEGEKKAVENAETTLKELTAKMPGEGGGGAMTDEARAAAKLSEATWPALKSQADELQARLGRPVQQKDLPDLESAVRGFESKLSSLPDPKDWEQKSKTLLDEWHRKATGS